MSAGFDPDEQEGFRIPSKIQTLIYAQALRGVVESARPVGALYFELYGPKSQLDQLLARFIHPCLMLQGLRGVLRA